MWTTMQKRNNWLRIALNKYLAVIGGIILLAAPVTLLARTSVADLEMRLEDLETKVESNVNLELANKVDSLEQEIQELRGMLEELHNPHRVVDKTASMPTAVAPTPRVQLKPELTVGSGEQPLNVGGAKISVASPWSVAEQEAYNAAYRLIESKDFPEAIVAFKDFLWQYQDSKYAPHATYWLGELYLTEDKLELASDYFLKVTDKYKDHSKAPDALFKLGMLEMERDNWQLAKDYFHKIKKEYADSSRVYMANAKLKILEQEGH